MRLRDVFSKSVYDRRHGIVWWSLAIALLAVSVLSAWPSVHDEYRRLVANYPAALLAFFGIERNGLDTAAGYLQAELFSLMVPLSLIAYMIAAGSAATAGEEEAGTLDLLLAQPVSRRRVLVEKYAAACAALLAITVVFVAVLVVFTHVFDVRVAATHLVAAGISGYLLATLFGAVALLAGCATGHRPLAAAIASALPIAAYLLTSLATLVEGLRRFRPASPFWWYSGHEPLRRGLEPLHVALLCAVTLVCVVASAVVFERRDLA